MPWGPLPLYRVILEPAALPAAKHTFTAIRVFVILPVALISGESKTGQIRAVDSTSRW
jgi:hypothetical protein